MAKVATSQSPRWLNRQEMRAWLAYLEASANLSSALDADLAPTGLSPGDYQVLVLLSEAPDLRLRMCDLAARLQLSPSGLTRRLDGLVRDGLVSREPSEADRRVMLAALSDRGLRTLEDAAPVHVESVRRRIFDRLTTAQVRALADIFETIQSGLDHDSPVQDDRP